MPEVLLAVAECWIDDRWLWFTMFVDDDDRKKVKIELLRPLADTPAFFLDLTIVESIVAEANRELLGMLDNIKTNALD